MKVERKRRGKQNEEQTGKVVKEVEGGRRKWNKGRMKKVIERKVKNKTERGKKGTGKHN